MSQYSPDSKWLNILAKLERSAAETFPTKPCTCCGKKISSHYNKCPDCREICSGGVCEFATSDSAQSGLDKGAGLEKHMQEDAAYFEKGIAHHQDVAKKLRHEIASCDSNNEALKLELMDRLDDTMGDIGRMEKELAERKAESIEPTMKGAPSMGKTAPVVEKGDVAKPQPRYLLKNKGPNKVETKPLGKKASDQERVAKLMELGRKAEGTDFSQAVKDTGVFDPAAPETHDVGVAGYDKGVSLRPGMGLGMGANNRAIWRVEHVTDDGEILIQRMEYNRWDRPSIETGATRTMSKDEVNSAINGGIKVYYESIFTDR